MLLYFYVFQNTELAKYDSDLLAAIFVAFNYEK